MFNLHKQTRVFFAVAMLILATAKWMPVVSAAPPQQLVTSRVGLAMREFDTTGCPGSGGGGGGSGSGPGFNIVGADDDSMQQGNCDVSVVGTSMIVMLPSNTGELFMDGNGKPVIGSTQNMYQQAENIIVQELVSGTFLVAAWILHNPVPLQKRASPSYLIQQYYMIIPAGSGGQYFAVSAPVATGKSPTASRISLSSRMMYDTACRIQNGCLGPKTPEWEAVFRTHSSDPDVPFVVGSSTRLRRSHSSLNSTIKAAYHGLITKELTGTIVDPDKDGGGGEHYYRSIRVTDYDHSYYYWSASNPLSLCRPVPGCGSSSEWHNDNNRALWGDHDGIIEDTVYDEVHRFVDVFEVEKADLYGALNDPPDASTWDVCTGYLAGTPCRCSNCGSAAFFGNGPMEVADDAPPYTVKLDPTSLDLPKWTSALDVAIKKWNELYPSGDYFVAGDCPEDGYKCIDVSVPATWSLSEGFLGVTYVGTTELVDPDGCGKDLNVATWPIEILLHNDAALLQADPPKDPRFGYWHNSNYQELWIPKVIQGISGTRTIFSRQLTLFHELGHALHLGHYGEAGDVMAQGGGLVAGFSGTMTMNLAPVYRRTLECLDNQIYP